MKFPGRDRRPGIGNLLDIWPTAGETGGIQKAHPPTHPDDLSAV